jgi:CubicO group peptidase (beta-lactamase class C family)
MKSILSLLVALGMFYTVTAQPLLQPATTPESAGFSSQRLERINQLIQSYIDSNYIEGAIALVARNGKIVYHTALGYDNKATGKKLQKDAIWRIASQTKAITSVAIMQLYEKGYFLLDDAVSKYIPAFQKPRVLQSFNKMDTSYTTEPAKREITIRDLLTHTSGIGYAQIGSETMNAIYAKAGVVGGIGLKGGLLKDNILRLAALPLVHQPGDRFTYGLNTDVLGYLVEVVSGLSLDAYFKQYIFDPLGMKDTYFYLPANKQSRLAMLHMSDKNNQVVNCPEELTVNGKFYRDYPNLPGGSFYSGGGGLASTAYDYAIFMQMLLNGGDYNGKHLFSRNSIRLMTLNQLGEKSLGRNAKFGLGFEIVTNASAPYSVTSEGSFSWGGMFASSYWIDPKEKIVAQFVLQQYPFTRGDIAEKFKVAVYQALQ